MYKVLDYDIKINGKDLEGAGAVLDAVRRIDAGNELDYYDKHITLDTVTMIKQLLDRARAVIVIDDLDDALGYFTIDGLDDYTRDNTYNYNMPLNHHIESIAQRTLDGDGFRLAVSIHFSGDVRCNYSKFIVMEFDSIYDIDDVFMEYIYTREHAFTIDGIKYTCVYSGAGDEFELYSGGECLSYSFIPEPWNEGDFIKSVKEELQTC